MTPTILDMIGYRVETGDFDGHPLRNIYQTAAAEPPTTQRVVHTDNDPPETRPVYWDDVDLKAWKKLDPALRPEYEHRPLTVHHPYSPYDMHNMAYDLLSISDFNVLRFFDEALSPFDNGRPVVTQAFGWVGDHFRHSSVPAIADAADALDVSTTTIGDYSFTSAGNMKRVDGTIDWLQHRLSAVDGAVARQFGSEQTPGVAAANKLVDGAQWWFWDVYQFSQRVAAEWIDEGVLNSIQDTADRGLNQSRLQPAQIIVDPSQLPK
jgi:hypothetical protein